MTAQLGLSNLNSVNLAPATEEIRLHNPTKTTRGRPLEYGLVIKQSTGLPSSGEKTNKVMTVPPSVLKSN